VMVDDNIDIFEISYEESVSYFKRLENWEIIRHTNGLIPASLPVENKQSVTSSIGKSSGNSKGSNMWCHYFEKNNHIKDDCREISKFNSRKRTRLALKPNLDPERNLWPCF
jgi:hypothetical protein